jgi:hypothetical protein
MVLKSLPRPVSLGGDAYAENILNTKKLKTEEGSSGEGSRDHNQAACAGTVSCQQDAGIRQISSTMLKKPVAGRAV